MFERLNSVTLIKPLPVAVKTAFTFTAFESKEDVDWNVVTVLAKMEGAAKAAPIRTREINQLMDITEV